MDLRRLRWSSEELCSSHPPPAWGWVVRQLVTIRGWAKQKSLMVGCHRAVRIWLQRRSWWRLPLLKNCFYFAGWILETGCCRISVAAIKKPVIVWLLLADHTRGQWTKHRVRDCDFYQTKMSKKIIPKSASRGLNLQIYVVKMERVTAWQDTWWWSSPLAWARPQCHRPDLGCISPSALRPE